MAGMQTVLRRLRASTLIAVAGTLLLPSAASADRSDWREMTVGHFELFSTLSDAGTRDVARQLQAFEQTLGQMLQTGDRLPDSLTRVYLLSDRDFNKYAAFRPGLGGFFTELPFGNVMVIDAGKSFDFVRVTIFHEFIHYIQRSTSTQTLPPWFVEGYAELFSGYSLYDQKLYIGNLPTGVGLRRDRWIPVSRLLAVQKRDPEYQAEHLAPQFYGESWALVHLLLFDDPALDAPTRRYLQLMDEGFPEPEAFANSFPFDKAALDNRLRHFLGHGLIHVRVFALRDTLVLDQAPLRRLSAAQADTEMTRLTWELNRPKDIVAELGAKALAERPGDRAVRALLARIAANRGEPIAIEDLVATLSTGGVDDPQERVDVAAAMMRAQNDEKSCSQVMAVLGDLVRQDEPAVEAAELWAAAAARTNADPAAIVAVLTPVRIRVPHDTYVLKALGRAFAAMGDKAKARDAYNQIILVSHVPEERHWAQRLADSPQLQDSHSP